MKLLLRALFYNLIRQVIDISWFKIHRSVFDHWVSTDAEAFLLWLYIVGMAAYEPTKKIIMGRLIELLPGQFLFRGPQLADQLQIDRNKIYRLIKLFESNGMISIKKIGKRYSIITVINYSVYQGDNLPIEKNRETNDKPKYMDSSNLEGLSLQQNEKQIRNKRETIYKNEKTHKNKENNIYSSHIQSFTENDELQKALEGFIEMRKKIKKPMTERAFTNLLSKLKRLTSDPWIQIQILDKSINNCWQDIYPLSEGGSKSNEKHGSGYDSSKILYKGSTREHGDVNF